MAGDVQAVGAAGRARTEGAVSALFSRAPPVADMRVAVLGAGYAGLTLAKRLEDALPDNEVVVVDEDGTHLVQHELHCVVRRPSLAEDITLDLREVLDRATVREATVTDVDPDAGIADRKSVV